MNPVAVAGSYIVALVMDVERIPLEGETLVGRSFHSTHGGKGSNMAVCASRLGSSVEFFGCVGMDSFGEKFATLLDEEKVGRSALLLSKSLPTAVGLIMFGSKGSNVIVIDTTANGEFSPADIEANREALAACDVVLSTLEIPLAAAAAAHSVGNKFILNPAPATDLRDTDLSSVFALTPNEREGRICLGLRPGPSDA